MSESENQLYTVEETRKILRICRSTMTRLIKNREIASIKIGRSIRISKKAIEKLLEGGAA